MTTVTGLTFPGDNVASLDTFDIPEPRGTEVRIAVKASGVCGSDLHPYCSSEGLREPGTNALLVAGHEPAGVIESVGAAVLDFKVGDNVLVYHIMGCGNCYDCRMGQPVTCTSPRRAAYGGKRNGAHAALLLVEERSLIKIPEPLTFIDGAMIACGVGTAFSALRKTEVKSGQRLLITGLGPVGLAAVQIAADMGVEVFASDPNAARVAEARKHGLTHAVEASGWEDAVAEIKDKTGGKGVDASLDCSGASDARLLCIHGVTTYGHVVFVGLSRQQLTWDPSLQLTLRQLTLRGSWVSSQAEMQECAELLARRNLHPEELVTHRCSIDEGVEVYQRFAAGESGKMVFTF